MPRIFLSGQTTCALLLSAGLLLRAQAALKAQEPAAAPSAIAPRSAKAPAPLLAAPAKNAQRISQSRKAFAHRELRHRPRKCGVAIAGRYLKCG
jgi:hypothetical protein